MDRPDVRHLARLARLRLDPAREKELERDLEGMLAFFRQLERLDTKGLEPLLHPFPIPGRLRPDQEGPCLPREKALENAPAREGPFFLAPPVLDEPPREEG